MSARCLCSRVRYSEWRLDVLQQLYALSPSTTRAQLPFLYPRTHRRKSQRCYTSKRKDPTEASRSTSVKLSEYGTADSLNLREESMAESLDQRTSSTTQSNDGSESPQTISDGGDRRPRQPQFDPHSEESRAMLRAALDSLKGLSQEVRHAVKIITPRPCGIDPTGDHLSNPDVTVKENKRLALRSALGQPASESKRKERRNATNPPQSPLIAHIRDRKRRLRSGKIAPDGDVISILNGDFWARSLTEPVRQCSGSHVRAPEGLLTKWNFTENDEDGLTYLLPGRLANMSTIRLLGEVKEPVNAKSKPEDHASVEEMEPVEATDNPDGIIHNFQPTPEPATVTFLPHLNLLRQITTSLTKIKPHSTVLSTAAGAALKVVPVDLRTKVSQLAHFERQRQLVAKRSHLAPTVSVPTDAILDFNGLQWDPKIAGRIITMLRERVVMALRTVLIINALRPPDPKFHRIDILPAELDDLSLWAPPEFAKHFSNHGGEHASTSAVPPAASSAYGPRNDPLHACFFLHIAAWPHPALKPYLQPSPAVTPSASTIRYLPPTIPITIDSQKRAPIFPLLPLLGEHHVASIREALCSYLDDSKYNKNGNLNLSIPGATTASSAQALIKSEQGFTILFRNAARYRTVVEKEVFRLWRYVGGRDAWDWWEHGVDVADKRVWGDPRLLEKVEGGLGTSGVDGAADRHVTRGGGAGGGGRQKTRQRKYHHGL